MENNKIYRGIGIALLVLAGCYIGSALMHPEWSFPWPNWVTYTIYVLYAIYTVLIFCMPKMKDASPAACLFIAFHFIALVCFAVSIGMRKVTGQNNWYLPIGLCCTSLGNFGNLYLKRKKAGKRN